MAKPRPPLKTRIGPRRRAPQVQSGLPRSARPLFNMKHREPPAQQSDARGRGVALAQVRVQRSQRRTCPPSSLTPRPPPARVESKSKVSHGIGCPILGVPAGSACLGGVAGSRVHYLSRCVSILSQDTCVALFLVSARETSCANPTLRISLTSVGSTCHFPSSAALRRSVFDWLKYWMNVSTLEIEHEVESQAALAAN